MPSLKAIDVATKNVITATPHDSLATVRSLMIKHGVGRIIITEGGKPVGVVTKKDIVRFLSTDDTDRSLVEIPVSEVMSSNLVIIKPELDIRTTASIMLDNNISSLLIVQDERLVGIVTKTDICRYCSDHCVGVFKVKDFMSRNVVYVRPMHSLFRIMNLMVKHDISRVVVIDKDGKPLGIVTLTDLTLFTSSLRPVKHPTFEVIPSTLILTAEDVMTKDLVTVREHEDISKASRIMIDKKISGLPVVNEEERLSGIVTKTDVVKAVACFKEA
ncbi:MAG: CBS domain-containing protein [Candidatus Nezhaarchaeota archaeon]|nr:CBS domain-containing protein [Candidatus Nezhaarchaeota archaeon]